MVTITPTRPVGDLLRDWRRRRRLSQLELALDADVSTRHLSFVETGRSQPSREMVLRLAERLDVPLRERNDLLIAAGYAPVYPQRSIDAPEMGPVRQALNKVLDGHEPYPALVVDRFWNLVMANNAAMLFLEGVPDDLVRPPVNVHRLALHPRGLASRVVNLPEVRAHLIARMARQVSLTGDPDLTALHEETKAYGPDLDEDAAHQPAHDIALPTSLRYGDRVLSFFSTVTTFGAAADVTLADWPSRRSSRRTTRRPRRCANARSRANGHRLAAGRVGARPSAVRRVVVDSLRRDAEFLKVRDGS